jgi:hypothetical protein
VKPTIIHPCEKSKNARRHVKAKDAQIMSFGKEHRVERKESSTFKAPETQLRDGKRSVIPSTRDSGLIECAIVNM